MDGWMFFIDNAVEVLKYEGVLMLFVSLSMSCSSVGCLIGKLKIYLACLV